jgi:type IV fimbrial biogenesis protein FimT
MHLKPGGKARPRSGAALFAAAARADLHGFGSLAAERGHGGQRRPLALNTAAAARHDARPVGTTACRSFLRDPSPGIRLAVTGCNQSVAGPADWSVRARCRATLICDLQRSKREQEFMSVHHNSRLLVETCRWRLPARASGLRGFTLIELCATLVVLIVLSALAAVAMSSTVSNNRVYAAQDEFSAYVAYARSEASRRGVDVLVSAVAPATGNAFGGGWTVCVDSDADGACDADPSATLRQHEALPTTIVVGDGTATTIAFTPQGFLAPAATVEVKVCATDPTLAGFDITIQPNGLVDVASVAANTAPCSGS